MEVKSTRARYWETAQDTTDPFDVFSAGSTVEAINASTESSGTVTINGDHQWGDVHQQE